MSHETLVPERFSPGARAAAPLMPVLFIGHGNPMNAIMDSDYSRTWERLGREIPRPRAILCISAHWETEGSFVTIQDNPKTIHDFYGFPDALNRAAYPCPGNPGLAKKLIEIGKGAIIPDDTWGIDHGTWSVLLRMYPEADIPVIQLSLDYRKNPRRHFDLAKSLSPLRKEGVLIMGSGNLVHNLQYAVFSKNPRPYDWATRFDEMVTELIVGRRFDALVDYPSLGETAAFSIPTNEHYLPLLYALAQAETDEPISFPVTGIDLGSVSMRAVKIG